MLFVEVYSKALTSYIINGIFNFMLNTNGLNRVSGIYSITHIPTGKVYIGSAVNIGKRWLNHLNDLRKGIHHSKHLQHAWNRYGEGSFLFSMLELVPDIDSLVKVEQDWLDVYQSYDDRCGYNLCEIAGNRLGQRHSEYTKAVISEKLLGTVSPLKGVSKTKEHVANHADSVSKYWIVIDPEGNELPIKNLRKFCRENGLNATDMWLVANGRHGKHKGWKCRYAVHVT